MLVLKNLVIGTKKKFNWQHLTRKYDEQTKKYYVVCGKGFMQTTHCCVNENPELL